MTLLILLEPIYVDHKKPIDNCKVITRINDQKSMVNGTKRYM